MNWYERALAQISVDWEALYTPTRYGSTHVIAAGHRASTVPIVLLHGINTNAAVWIPQIVGLSQRHRVIAPDIPGYVGRGSSARFPYEGSHFGDWLADVFDGLGIERAIIVGGSAGGYFALKFAAYYPERTLGVLLLNPSGLTRYRFGFRITRVRWAVPILYWIGEHWLYHRSVARWIVQRGMNPDIPVSEANVELAQLIFRYYRRRIPPPILPDDELNTVSAPVALVASTREPYTVMDEVVARVQTMHRVHDVTVLTGVGHDINKERPAWVNQRIEMMHAQIAAGLGLSATSPVLLSPQQADTRSQPTRL